MNKMIVKLDRRHRAYGWFTHMIDFKQFRVVKFPKASTFFVTHTDCQIRLTDMRIWMWDTFGPSCELDQYDAWLHSDKARSNWTWDTNNNHLRIYMTAEVTSHVILTNVLDNPTVR